MSSNTMASRTRSYIWILVAYLVACGAGGAWLLLAEGNPLLHGFIADVIATVVIFAFSRAFKNSSFYDAYWSVIPPLLLLYWWVTRSAETVELRYWLLSIPLWYWAIRLTWNWGKHWEGLHHEDWRYGMLKQRMPRIEIFTDFFGIHFFPTVQVFLGMLPVYAAVAISTREVNWLDYVACFLGIAAATIQLVADRQLHRFIANRKPGEIIRSGLWGWSRHPNYFGELLFWFSMALFGLAALPEGWWWQIIGFSAMLVMFVFVSVPLMETRSLERRPSYQKVIDEVSMLVPLPPKRG
jgi:steroid 5-alpha reductase family enzyme